LLELNVLHAQDRHIVDERLCKQRDFCNEDANYNMITEDVVKGFPIFAINIPDTLMPYYKAQYDLYLDSDGFLCHKNTFLVLVGLRDLPQAAVSHAPGCTKYDCKSTSITLVAILEETSPILLRLDKHANNTSSATQLNHSGIMNQPPKHSNTFI
jgi:hypothetical protein